MRLFLSAALLGLFAVPASAQAPSAPAPDALVDRLVRVLPHQEEFAVEPQVDAQDLARLTALNPGREQEIRAILLAHATCSSPFLKDATMRALRGVARNFGAEKLGRLIAFYEGPDGKTFERIAVAADKGQAPSAADEKEVARIMAAYPLADWAKEVSGSGRLMQDDQAFLQGITRCATEQEAALARAKLKAE